MLFRTHLIFGILASLLIYKLFNFDYWIFILIGSFLPDLDVPNSKFGKMFFLRFFFKHRGFFHSIIFGILLGWSVYSFNSNYGIGILIGFLSHVILDGMSVNGIRLFYPFKFKVKGFVKVGGMFESVLFYCIFAFDVLLLVKLLSFDMLY